MVNWKRYIRLVFRIEIPGTCITYEGGFFMSEIHVLVVDDEKEIADLVEIYLVSDGYKVYKASNALEGLEILEKERSTWCCLTS